MLKATFLVISAVLVLAEATDVKQCANAGRSFDSIKQVDITGCVKTPCKLKKKTIVSIEERFVPNRDVNTVTNTVHADILGVPLPFIGVDSTNACNNIKAADDSTTGCPLKAGTEYIYRNQFDILPFYPTLSLVVNWALTENGEPITCFQAPSKIVN